LAVSSSRHRLIQVTRLHLGWLDPPALMRSSEIEEIAIVGMQAREARELALAAEAVGLVVHPLPFGSPLADAALAAHGPGSVRLPLAIVAGRYSLERPAFGAVIECIEVLRGTRRTLPAGCVALSSTTGYDGHEQPALEPEEPVPVR
jgi:hypothetical protein